MMPADIEDAPGAVVPALLSLSLLRPRRTVDRIGCAADSTSSPLMQVGFGEAERLGKREAVNAFTGYTWRGGVISLRGSGWRFEEQP
jgi:hypothetical protein